MDKNPSIETVDSLIKLIRQVVKEELSKDNRSETFYNARVNSYDSDTSMADVEINGEMFTIPNKTGEELSANTMVRVFATSKLMIDAYVGRVL